MIVGYGQFSGRGNHVLRGGFILQKSAEGQIAFETSDDFYFDGSPAPGFAWSYGGRFDEGQAIANDFLRLPSSGSLTGPQIEVKGKYTADLQLGFEPTAFDAVFLWCFGVPFLLGVARLEFAP